MIDDLTLQGVSEPYRMLTSRAEYRLRLRANNASTRLTGLGIAAGCVGEERRQWFDRREDLRERIGAAFEEKIHARELADTGLQVRRDGGEKPLSEWLRHDGIDLDTLDPWLGEARALDPLLAAEMAEDAAYAPYLARQDAELRDLRASEALPLPCDFPYDAVPGLSNEMVERLTAAAPSTLAAAGRVPGITPAALSALLVHARRRQGEGAEGQRAA
jgi:tRNA uridine 5-carboxymethylaminomethyl modification enzyme